MSGSGQIQAVVLSKRAKAGQFVLTPFSRSRCAHGPLRSRLKLAKVPRCKTWWGRRGHSSSGTGVVLSKWLWAAVFRPKTVPALCALSTTCVHALAAAFKCHWQSCVCIERCPWRPNLKRVVLGVCCGLKAVPRAPLATAGFAQPLALERSPGWPFGAGVQRGCTATCKMRRASSARTSSLRPAPPSLLRRGEAAYGDVCAR